MALGATVYTFQIDLAHNDRGHYEALDLRVARHPSESAEYLVTRVMAFCLEHAEGIEFSGGLSDPEEPTLSIRDLTGAVRTWVEIGAPDAARLHKAAKAAGRVVVYTHRDPVQVLKQLEGQRIHRAEAIDFYSLDRTFVASLAARLERRMAMSISVSDGHLMVALDDGLIEGTITRHRVQ